MTVRFTYKELSDLSSKLGPRIMQAFGSQGFGACLVSNIPDYVSFRSQLLPLSYKLAHLPQNELSKLERPLAFHSKGWSHGVEKFKGISDTSKGSFYNNALYDSYPELTEEEIKIMGSSIRLRIPNVWPTESVPELELAYKNLGRLMIDVGALLAYHIDLYVSSQCSSYKFGTLTRFIREGDNHTGRLLHYFSQKECNVQDEWCGWHNDHSALTALTSPLYMSKDGAQLEDYNNTDGGLMVKNRFADITKISIPKDNMMFQIGETAQIVTGGYLEATPHCVVGGKEPSKLQINRNTFAVFMGPRHNQKLNVPEGIDPNSAMNREAYQVPPISNRWKKDITFQEYSERSYQAYA